MNTSMFTVQGNYHSSAADIDCEAPSQTIARKHAPFVLPVLPEQIRVAAPPTRTPHRTEWATSDAVDDFFGATPLHATRESPHDLHLSLSSEIPPPSYADTDIPAYSADPNTEPVTLTKYLFKFGFLFPPFWVLGAMMLILPLSAPVDFESSESERVRWARRCALALVTLVVLAGIIVAISLAVLHSRTQF